MTEQTEPTDSVSPAPNMMVLKGVVWGLGVLLLLGFALVAAIITMGPSEPSYAEAVTLELVEGEDISASAVEGQTLTFVVARDGLPHRIVIIDMRTNESQVIPVNSAESVTDQ